MGSLGRRRPQYETTYAERPQHWTFARRFLRVHNYESELDEILRQRSKRIHKICYGIQLYHLSGPLPQLA